jgi:DNA-binding LacI/PurR family transcriptional regulator
VNWPLNKKSKETFQEQIINLLNTEIESGKYKKGDKLPSLRTFGEIFKVSHETVKSALEILQKQGMVETIPQRGTFVTVDGKMANHTQNHTLGIVIDLGEDPVSLLVTNLYDRYIRLFSQKLVPRSYNLVSQYINISKKSDQDDLTSILEKTDGIFMIRLNTPQFRDFLIESNKPVVNILPAIDPIKFDSVGIHDYETYYNLTKSVISKGYRNPLYFDGPLEYDDRFHRMKGFLNACTDNKIEDPESRLLFAGEFNIDIYYNKMKEWLNIGLPLDVVIAVNDNFAIGALKALTEKNIPVPEEVAIIGGYNTPLSIASFPTLSTLDIHYEQLTDLAIERMSDLINQPSKYSHPIRMMVDGDLIYRESFPEKNRKS